MLHHATFLRPALDPPLPQQQRHMQMAGLLAMPTLLPEGVLSAEGEDVQAVNSSWETARSPSIEPGA